MVNAARIASLFEEKGKLGGQQRSVRFEAGCSVSAPIITCLLSLSYFTGRADKRDKPRRDHVNSRPYYNHLQRREHYGTQRQQIVRDRRKVYYKSGKTGL